jgi:Bacterial regulatory proteins, luxR family
VLSLIREGLTNPQIAERLGVTESAAKFHVSEILSKLGVESRQEAAAYSAMLKRSWLVLPFFALPEHWKMAVRRRGRLAGVAAAGAATVSLILLVGLLTRRDGSGTQTGEASSFDEALAPDVPPIQPPATFGPEAFLGTPCQRTAVATKHVNARMMAISLINFCVTWSDVFENETGFRVEIKHGGGEFVYHLPADTTEVFPPPSDWPYGAVKEVQVEVYAEMPAGEEMVDRLWLRSDATWGAGQRPGDPAVYARIEGLTSCTLLQGEAGRAETEAKLARDRGESDLIVVSLAYMQTANARMKKLGC